MVAPTWAGERSYRLFLGNLSYDVDEADLNHALQGCTGLTFLAVRRTGDTQRSRGHGHADFASEHEAVAAAERLQGLEIKGRCIRVDWCDNAMRRKYPISAAGSFRVPQRGNVGSGSGNSLGFLSAQEEVVDLVDTDGRITPMAMKAVEEFTVQDLCTVLDELLLLLPSAGSLLQHQLQQSPMLRAALLQAQLLVGRHPNIPILDVPATVLDRAKAFHINRLLSDCRALPPPPRPQWPLPGNSFGDSLGGTKQISQARAHPRKGETTSLRQQQRRRKILSVPPMVQEGKVLSSSSLQYSHSPAAAIGVPALSPITPDTANGVDVSELHIDREIKLAQDCREKAKGARMSPCVEQHGERLAHAECIASQYTTTAPATAQCGLSAVTSACTPEDVPGQPLKQGHVATSSHVDHTKSSPTTSIQTCNPPNSSSLATWAAEAETQAAVAPPPLVDEVLRSNDLLQRILNVSVADLLSFGEDQRQQVLSVRKALRERGHHVPDAR